MTTVVARFKLQPGKEEEAEKALAEMAAAVEANEPGALAYVIHRSQADPLEVVFFEVYSDRDAFRAHTQTPHMAAFQGKLPGLADLSTVKIDRMDRFAGFIRSTA